MSPLEIGSVGAGLVLLCFVLGQLHVWRDTYFVYDVLNFIGGGMLTYYAFMGKSWPFFVLNGIWTVVALRDCMLDLSRNRHKRSGGFWKKWLE